MIKVYVAAPWIHRDQAINAGKVLREAGYEVTSRWFTHEGDPNDSTGITVELEKIQNQAIEDFQDVLAADVIVVLNIAKSEGKAVETGFALAHGIDLISVGKRSNIFQSLGVEVETLADAVAVLNQWRAEDEPSE